MAKVGSFNDLVQTRVKKDKKFAEASSLHERMRHAGSV
jgi:hypothetical protein